MNRFFFFDTTQVKVIALRLLVWQMFILTDILFQVTSCYKIFPYSSYYNEN